MIHLQLSLPVTVISMESKTEAYSDNETIPNTNSETQTPVVKDETGNDPVE